LHQEPEKKRTVLVIMSPAFQIYVSEEREGESVIAAGGRLHLLCVHWERCAA